MKIIKLILVISILFNLSSCMVVGKVVGGKNTTTEKQYTLNTKGSVEQDKKALKKALYKDGYTKINELDSFIQFQKKGAIMTEMMLSKTKITTITADFTNENIALEILQHGNFNIATEKKTDKVFETIKKNY